MLERTPPRCGSMFAVPQRRRSPRSRWGVYADVVSCGMPRIPVSAILIPLAIGLLGVPPLTHPACNVVDGKAYGDCSGVRVNTGSKGHLTVRSYTSESAIIGGATVLKGGALELSGISNGDILVYRGGRLRLTGIVNGTVRNLGGNVEVEGILDRLYTSGGNVVVGGNVGSVSGDGPVHYKRGAVVGGIPIERAVRKNGKQ